MAAATVRKHLVSLYVANKFGVLNRIALVFARRGFNIDSMVVSEAHDPAFSHMNIVATGDEKTIGHILMQLGKLVDVVHAVDNTGKDVIQRELALVKVRCPRRSAPRCWTWSTPSRVTCLTFRRTR